LKRTLFLCGVPEFVEGDDCARRAGEIEVSIFGGELFPSDPSSRTTFFLFNAKADDDGRELEPAGF
jgi:hypothetical protein